MAVPRLKQRYQQEITPRLMEQFGLKNRLAVPHLQKIVVSMGVGAASQDAKILDGLMENLAMITGQRPAVRRAKKAIANFKIRKGLPVGCMVTLRGRRMYEFLDRFISIAMPRIRDFRGVPADSFDEHGNFSLGLREQSIFPEVDPDKVAKVHGMNVTMVITGKSRQQSLELLKQLGIPFRS